MPEVAPGATEAEIEETVARLVSVELRTGPDRVRAATSFRGQLGMDSISAANLLFAVEEEYGIELDPDEVARLDSLADVVAAVRRVLGGRA